MGSTRLNNADGTGREEARTDCLATKDSFERSEHCLSCIELQAKLGHTEEALRNARKAAREGLMDMAEQNAKLVAAYVEKKREVKQLQAAAKEDRRLWQHRLQRLEHELQANKLHIQALMQQLHAISTKQALKADAQFPTTPVSCSAANRNTYCETAEPNSPAASCSSSSGGCSAGAPAHPHSSCNSTAAGSSGLDATSQHQATDTPAPACSPLCDSTNRYSRWATPTSTAQPFKQQHTSGGGGSSSQKPARPAGCKKAAYNQENQHPGSSTLRQSATAAAGVASTTQQRPFQSSKVQVGAEENQQPSAAAAAGPDQSSRQQCLNPGSVKVQSNHHQPQQHVPVTQQRDVVSPGRQQQLQQGPDAKPQDQHARLVGLLQRSLGSAAAAARAAHQAPAGQAQQQQQQQKQKHQQEQQEMDTQRQNAQQEQRDMQQGRVVQESQVQQQQCQQQQQQPSPQQKEAREQAAQRWQQLQHEEDAQQQAEEQAQQQHQQEEEEQLAQLARRMEQLEAENAELREAQAEAAVLKATVQRMQEAEQLKQRGNTLFQLQQYKEAWRAYTEALALKIEDDSFTAVLLCNRAAALHCCGQYVEAILDCCVAAQLDDKYPRVLQRRAEAYMAVEDYSNAVADLQRLVQLNSSSKEAAVRLRDAQHKLRAHGGAGPNYYTILGLQHGCSTADVKAAYKKLALKYHPDKAAGPHAKAAAEAVFVLITAANAVLSDAAKRAAHDAAHLAIRARRCMSNSSSSSGAGTHATTPQHQRQRQQQQPASSSTSTNSSASSAGVYGSWHQPQPGGFGYAAAAEVATAKAAAAAAEAARWRNATSQSRYGGSPAAGSSSSSSSNASGASSHAFRARFI